MATPEEIFERAEKYFWAIGCDRRSCLDFTKVVNGQLYTYFRESVEGKSVIDIGCGELPDYGWKIAEFPVKEYVGIDPYLVPEEVREGGNIRYVLGNPLKFLVDQEPESAVCVVNNLDKSVLTGNVLAEIPEEVVAYVNELNRLIARVTPQGGILIATDYLGSYTDDERVQNIKSLGFHVEHRFNELEFMRKG